jgi:DNA mismatch repair protein MutS
LALAQAIVEYIVQKVRARCLFATHYHELTALEGHLPGVVSFYADSVQTAQGILFLHKIVPGRADGSFGIEVAKLAHIPPMVIQRAQQILQGMPEKGVNLSIGQTSDLKAEVDRDLDNKSFKASNLAVCKIKEINFDYLTPKAAFDLLYQISKDLEKEGGGF